MAYTKKMEGEFSGENNRYWTWEIWSSSGGLQVASPKLLADGVTINWESGDDIKITEGIVSSTCTLNFICDHNDQITFLTGAMKSSEAATLLKVYDEDGWTWYGQIVPEASGFELTGGLTEVEMVFSDGLSLLKGKDYSQSDSSLYTGGQSSLKIVRNILGKIPWVNEFIATDASFIRESRYLTTTHIEGLPNPDQRGLMNRIVINNSALYQEKKQRYRFRPIATVGKVENCYDILHDIMQTLGCRIVWNGREWHVYSVLNWSHMAQGHTSHHSMYWTLAGIDANGLNDGTYEEITPYKVLDQTHDIVAGAKRLYSPKYQKVLSVHENAPSGDLEIPASLNGPLTWNTGNRLTLIGGNLSAYDDTITWVADDDLRINVDAYVGHNFENEIERYGMLQCFVVKLSCTIGGQRYVLNGPVKHYPTPFTLQRDTASNLPCYVWDYFDDPEWILESEVDDDPTSKPGIVYIPFQSLDSYASGNIDTIQAGDKFLPTPAYTHLHPGETDILQKDKDNKDFNINLTWEVPVRPNDGTDWELQAGYAIFHRDKTELANSLTQSLGWGFAGIGDDDRVSTPHSGESFTQDFTIRKCFVGTGEAESGDLRYWSASDSGAIESINIINTRVASGRNWQQGPSFLRQFNGTSYPVAITWNSFRSGQANKKSNLDVLNHGWMRFFANSIETLEAEFVIQDTIENAHDIITPDMSLTTGCIGGGTTVMLPYKLSWSPLKGYTGKYFHTNQLQSEIVVTEEIEDVENDFVKPGVSPFTYNPSSGGGMAGVGITVDSKVGKPSSFTAGDVLKIDANGDAVSLADGELPITKLEASSENFTPVYKSGAWTFEDKTVGNAIAITSVGDSQGYHVVFADPTAGATITDVYRDGGGLTFNPNTNLLTTTNATVSTQLTAGGLSYPTADGTTGQAIVTDGAGNLSFGSATPGAINDLTDVTTTGATKGEILVFNGANWIRGNAITNPTDASTIEFKPYDALLGNSAQLTIDSVANSARLYMNGAGNVNLNLNPGTTGVTSFNRNDSLGDSRSFLRADNTDDSVSLVNRTANAPVYIKANNGTAGAGGETEVIEVLHNSLRFFDAYNMPTADGTANQVLTTDGAGTLSWADESAHGMNDLDDAIITSVGIGEVLQWSGIAWINRTFAEAGIAEDITDLGDVTIASPSSGQVLEYNGSAWVNTDAAPTVYTFDKNGVHEMATATAAYKHVAHSKTGGPFDSSTATLPTATAYMWKAQSHIAPAALTDFTVKGFIGGCTTAAYGKFESTQYRGEAGTVYLYKFTNSGTTGTWTSLGTAAFTIDATDARELEDYTITVTGASVAAGDGLLVVMDFSSLSLTTTGYVHHSYTIEAS